MNTTVRTTDYEYVSGLFHSSEELQQGVDTLLLDGVTQDQISVLMNEETRNTYFSDYQNTVTGPTKEIVHTSKSPEGATAGGLTGGVVGAIIGGLTLVGNVFAPGIGLLVAGPIVGALTGGIIGVAAGGLVGALIGAGIPEEEAKYYQNELNQNGRILLVVYVPKEQAKSVSHTLEKCGAKGLKIYH